MLTVLPFAKMEALVMAYNSACCGEVVKGENAALATSKGATTD